MNKRDQLDPYSPQDGSRLIYLQAPASEARRRYLESWLASAAETGAAVWLLSCEFERGGTWAGIRDLLRKILPDVEKSAPELIRQHASEIGLVLPTLRKTLIIENRTLTDTASPTEKVRNYPLDRAYRLVQGLINLLHSWQKHAAFSGWVLVCDNFERSGALVRFFCRELIRRRGVELNLTIVVPGESSAGFIDAFPEGVEALHIQAQLNAEPEVVHRDPQRETALAKRLEEIAASDHLMREELLPELIDHWLHSETPERALFWTCLALAQTHHFGFYEDALRYGDIVLRDIERICDEDKMFPRWTVVGTIVESYLALGKPETALELTLKHGLEKENEPATLVRICYVLALIYSRFLSTPDFEKADSFVQLGLDYLKKSDLGDQDKHFLKVFTLNGLAFIRHRQGRPEEALELCKSGFSLLNENLSPDQHRLHRSVLLYNMAQVYAAMHSYDEAVAHYSRAMEFDPNYSEYYNERGNIFLKLGRLPEAIADYREAIRLSAPYHEVFINMGQAYKLLGNHHAAFEAYSKALDLSPGQLLPLLGRAQVCEALGKIPDAIADYTAALMLDKNQPLALANRATLYYEIGSFQESIKDLDLALALEPGNADLYHNRAVALIAAGRYPEARRDLVQCLQIGPDAADLPTVHAHLVACESACGSASHVGAG